MVMLRCPFTINTYEVLCEQPDHFLLGKTPHTPISLVKGEVVWCYHQQQPSVSAFISYSTYTFKGNFTDIINTQQNTVTLN